MSVATTAAAAATATTSTTTKSQVSTPPAAIGTVVAPSSPNAATANSNNNNKSTKKSVQITADSENPNHDPAMLVTAGFVPVSGPVDPRDTLIVFDIPIAPLDPKKSVRLRQRLSLAPEPESIEQRVVELLDRLISPREWMDESGTRWEQHASPYPSPRADVVRTQSKLQTMMRQQGGRETGICHVRSALYSECFLEVLRQTIAENWERGLLLLSLHSHIVDRQKAHRELFESRIGFSFRLALCSDRDVAALRREIASLEIRREELSKEEESLRKLCDATEKESQEQMRVDEKLRNDEIIALKKEGNQKRGILEMMTQPTHRNI